MNDTTHSGIAHPHGFGPVPEFDNIPDYMKQHCVWCVWHASPKIKRPDKFDKISSNGLRNIGSNSPADWLTFEQAVHTYQSRPGVFNGIGVLIRPEDNLTYIDVDDEVFRPWDYWLSFPTYIERSPSGVGMRIISQGQVTRDTTKPVEVYCGHSPRFVTITGDVISQHEVTDCSSYIEEHVLPVSVEDSSVQKELPRPEILSPPTGFTPITFTPGSDQSSEMLTICLRLLSSNHSPGLIMGMMLQSPEVMAYTARHRNAEHKYIPFLWDNNLMLAVQRYTEDLAVDVFDVVIPPDNGTPAPELQEGQVRPLVMTDFADLELRHFAPIRWLIDDFLPPGVSMLVGKPKFGKSWLVHAMMLRIAVGGEIFGHPVQQSKCLYMALEDSDHRIKTRTLKLCQSMNIAPGQLAGNFFHLTEAERLDSGLVDQIRDLLQRTPDLRVICIDVLARIRGSRATNTSLFDFDYGVGKQLKAICADYPELSIILVHHAAKYAQDSSEATSGTNGLNAGMDNVFVLMKGDNGVELHIHARDVENQAPIPLSQGDDGMWTLASREVAAEDHQSDTRTAILRAIDAGARSPQEVEIHTGLSKGVVDQRLYHMVRQNILRKAGRANYVRVVNPAEEPYEGSVDSYGPEEFRGVGVSSTVSSLDSSDLPDYLS